MPKTSAIRGVQPAVERERLLERSDRRISGASATVISAAAGAAAAVGSLLASLG
jgi:hypothetical protein